MESNQQSDKGSTNMLVGNNNKITKNHHYNLE